jgi:1-acyl-sn-glycerol-3-phosphate acyltransferase
MSGWIAADALDRDGVAARTAPRRCVPAVAPDSPRRQDIETRVSPAGVHAQSAFAPSVVVRRSPWRVRMFTRHVKRFYLSRHFHAVRLSRSDGPVSVPDVPLIVVLNHPSWWDPLVALVLAELFPDRVHYAPMDADALERYRIFKRLGVFGVEPSTRRGSREFLCTSRSILAQPQTALWITAQGRFADARERPPRIQPGVAHLASRLDRGVILPLALEYPFWNDRRPEALARFGQTIVVETGADQTVEQWRTCIETALSSTQDALAREAQERDPAAFQTLVGDKAEFAAIHDWSRWLRKPLKRVNSHAQRDGGRLLVAPRAPS